jgi:hypothetical protein
VIGYSEAGVPDVYNLYVDDSGTRHPDHDPGREPAHGHDWFGMGGVMVRESDETVVRQRHADLCAKWKLTYPLHSAEIRACSENFCWLGELPKAERNTFLTEVTALLTSPELIAVACVIDRPGYNHRYREKYGRGRWSLCKTAFTVLVERALKFARERKHRLRVLVERADKKTDRMVEGYYDDLRANGHPFDANNSTKYVPLATEDFSQGLYEFKTKNKSSPIMQIADLALWPMCIGGYDPNNRSITLMRAAGILIDNKLDSAQLEERGIKYSCWDLENARKNQSPVVTPG